MLTNLQKNIRLSAHYAAQHVIENYIDGETPYGRLTYIKRRMKIMDLLAENGFGRFLLEKQDPDYKYSGLQLAGFSCARTSADEDGSWSAYQTFRVSEVAAYLEFIGDAKTDSEACLEYINNEFGSEEYCSGPGRPFNNGWRYHFSKSGKRIIGDIHGGLDI